jgi:hypothetical protein
VIWQVWSFRGGVALVVLTLTFAVFPKSSSVTVVNWLLGVLLGLTCVFVVAFEIVVGAKMLYLAARRS